MTQTLSIDIETYSDMDLKKTGAYRYVESPEFRILLFGYAVDNGPVHVVDLAQGQEIPDDIVRALLDRAVTKTAFNAQFERICLSAHFGWPEYHPPEEWDCTQVRALMAGLPIHLAGVAQVLKLDVQKDAAGTRLINKFSKPQRSKRNLPTDHPEDWQRFVDYCRQDVTVERAIRKKLLRFCVPDPERRLWELDQEINDRGIGVDTELVQSAIWIDTKTKQDLMNEAQELTGLDNPNSTAQLSEWLADQDVTLPDMTKQTITQALKDDLPDAAQRALELRQQLAKSSVKKYEAAARAVCSDGRIRGTLQYYAANRTGRFGGRLIQVHNLPQNHLTDLDGARALVRSRDVDSLELFYDSIPDVLSQLIRTCLIAAEGKTFVVSDFSAIEARVIAWLAGEQWRLDVFNTHGKIYEASASAMFSVPLEQIDKGSPLRQQGKVAELACGFSGGVGALQAMDSGKKIDPSEYQGIIDRWRKASPNIVKLWRDMEDAAMEATRTKDTIAMQHGLSWSIEGGALWCTLPSGRRLCYVRPAIGTNRFGRDCLTFEGVNGTTNKWERMETWKGTIVENVVQATARDCLAHTMLKLHEADWPIVMHVHDEVVVEVDEQDAELSLEAITCLMGEEIPWAPGLPMAADGYVTPYYKKD